MVQLKSPFLALHHDYFDDTLLTPRTWYTEQELKCNSILLLISYRGSISGGPSINATETGYFLVFCDPSSLRHHWLGPGPGCQVARILSIFCELHFGARLVISKISVTKLRLVKCDTSRLKLHDSLSAENNATRKTLIWKCHSYVTSPESLSPPTVLMLSPSTLPPPSLETYICISAGITAALHCSVLQSRCNCARQIKSSLHCLCLRVARPGAGHHSGARVTPGAGGLARCDGGAGCDVRHWQHSNGEYQRKVRRE